MGVLALLQASIYGGVPDVMLKAQRHNIALKENETSFVQVDAPISGMSNDMLKSFQTGMAEDMSGERPPILASEIEGVSNETMLSPSQLTAKIAMLEFQVRLLMKAVNELIAEKNHVV